MSEQDLIVRCQKGDTAAFEQLIHKYEKQVINTAYKMFGNPEDAYDMAQEVFLKVYRQLETFHMQSSFSTWLYRITANVCLDELRKRKRRINPVSLTVEDDEQLSELPVSDDSASPETIAQKHELSRVIQQAISELDDVYRIVITLREIDGLDYQAISEVLGISLGTTKSRISRARRQLKEKLMQYRELFDFDSV